ncbi:hypothetical protein Poli38472_013522 [Pythium oligandrum]|uniref:DUF4246 domain-containing protein n=1 Tax=Pythium oligandrum TaxID=41045 RepID=A0A8K1FGS5_PYTOL|nr:hypothetical protein Poli38472_013522 [Pythium oligandrum]|eukprot:TMW58048.1 hypothetical protein Poli38472_013522 [Pythium oligandrum]
MLMKVRTGLLDEADFATSCPDVSPHPLEMDAIWFHVNKAKEQLDKMRSCIINTLDMVIQSNNLAATSNGEGFISPGPVNETWFSDSLVPVDLKTAFVDQVSVLEGVPDKEKDWHPGSDNQVLDLVHPSLYCCVSGKTKRMAESGVVRGSSVVDHMHHIAFKATDVVYPRSTVCSWSNDVCQWIPSDVAVDKNGHVKFLSYINNLHPEDHAAMYDSIASICERFVPLFDRVLSALASESERGPQLDTSCDRDYYSENDMTNEHIPSFPDAPKRYIAEIHLTPEKPQYPGGSWHIEGSDSENIVATGLYYFGCDNITESKLSFRVIVQEPDEVDKDTLSMAAMYGLRRDEMLVQSLGAATAIEDRCLVFPNTLQHKVEPFELADPTKPGVRKILAFFLVDPTKTIPSTSVIPPQQEEWLQRLVAPMLEAKGLPVAAMEEQLTHLVSDGMTLEEAKRFRRELMDARRSESNFDDNEELYFSLCEH